MSEEELQREILSGAFSMQVADCEKNIRIQFEKLQQENKQLKDINTYDKRHLYKMNKDRLEANERLQQERDLYKSVIEEVREYIETQKKKPYKSLSEKATICNKYNELLQILDKVKEVK